MKADLALSKELASTPRSKPAVRQYKPWTRKKKVDEALPDSSAPVPDHVIPSEPIQATDEIPDQPVGKTTKKKRAPQQPVTPSSPAGVASSSTITMETPVIAPAMTLEAVPVEE